MMPNRMLGVSGVSSAYTPPAQPLGTPARMPAAAVVAVVFRNLRRDCFISLEPPVLERVRKHQIRQAILFSWCGAFQERTGENVCVPGAYGCGRVYRVGHLDARFLTDVPTGRTRGDSNDRRACRVVQSILRTRQPPGVIEQRGGQLGSRFEFDSRAQVVNVLDRKSTRLNSSHSQISYAVFCLKKKIK